MTKFHVKDGLFFEQLQDGGVRITQKVPLSKDIVYQVELDKDAWASVIASMSYYGEQDSGFYRALNFHAGEPIHPTTPLNANRLRPVSVDEA